MDGYRRAADCYSIREDVYYADDAIVPDIMARELPMPPLDRHGGVQKVQRIFGAKPLGYNDIAVEIENVKKPPREVELRGEVDDLKPHVFDIRMYSDSQAQRLTRLHNLKVLLCRGASGEVLVGDDATAFSYADAPPY